MALQELKRARLQTLARALSDRDKLTLRFDLGSKADIERQIIYVHNFDREIVPGVPASPGECWVAQKATTSHEVGHIRYSDNGAWQEAKRVGRGVQVLVNIIEDARVERAMANRFPGTLMWFRFLNDYIFQNRKDWGIGPAALFNAIASYTIIGKVPPAIKEQEDVIGYLCEVAPLLDEGREAPDTWGVLEKAKQVWEIIKEYVGEYSPKDPLPDEMGTPSPESAPEGKLDSRRKPERLPKPEKPREAPKSGKEPPEEFSEEEPAGVKAPEETPKKEELPEEDAPEEKVGGTAPGAKESEAPHEPEGELEGETGSGAGKEGETEKEAGSGEPDGEPEETGGKTGEETVEATEESEETPVSLGDEAREETEAGGETDEETDVEPEGSRGEPETKEKIGEEEQGGELESGEEETGRETAEEGGEPSVETEETGTEPETSTGLEEGTDEDGEMEGAADFPCAGKPETEDAGPEIPEGCPETERLCGFEPEEPEDYTGLLEAAEGELEDMFRHEKASAPLTEPTPDFEKIAEEITKIDIHRGVRLVLLKPRAPEDVLKNSYQAVLKKVSPLIKRTVDEIRRVLEYKMSLKEYAQTKGKLHGGSLWKLKVADPGVFYRVHQPSDDPELAVYLLVDCSGSMRRHGRIQRALEATALLHEACKELKVPHCVTGFYSGHYSRGTVYHLPVIKFSDQSSHKISELKEAEENRDGYSIRVAVRELAVRPERNKALIVLSDGLPCDPYLNYDFICRRTGTFGYGPGVLDTARAVREAEKAGVKVVGVYFGYADTLPVAQKMYNNLIFVERIEHLPPVIGKVLKKLVVG